MGFGKDGLGVIFREEQTVTVGGLAAGISVKAAANSGITEDFRILKTEYKVQELGTITDGDRIWFGLCANEYSVAEISEAMQIDGPIDPAATPEAEAAMRPVWLLDFVGLTSTAEGRIALKGEFNPRWTFSDATGGWIWFAYNLSTSPITTGASVKIQAKHFGVWVQ